MRTSRKFQISKKQIPNKTQTANHNKQNTATIKGLLSLFDILKLGIGFYFVIWFLRFVISSLAKKNKTSRFSTKNN